MEYYGYPAAFLQVPYDCFYITFAPPFGRFSPAADSGSGGLGMSALDKFLLKAVQQGNLDDVSDYLAEHASPDAANADGYATC